MVAPEDLANLCAIFKLLKVNKLNQDAFKRIVLKSLRLNSTTSYEKIIEVGLGLGVIALIGDELCITKIGSELGKAQKNCQHSLTNKAKLNFIKRIYLNFDGRNIQCSEFLSNFVPDAPSGTFILHRTADEQPNHVNWIKCLERVGFLTSGRYIVSIREKYLPLFNQFLKIRRGIFNKKEDSFRKSIGNIAEELALRYEEKRLEDNKHSELAPLIQRISIIDDSAGYDISSYRGTGAQPASTIYIEVKGTTSGNVQFFWSQNERKIADRLKSEYWIYCYTNIDLKKRTGVGPLRVQYPIKKVCRPKYSVEPVDVFVQKIK